jgi:TolA-binding protein
MFLMTRTQFALLIAIAVFPHPGAAQDNCNPGKLRSAKELFDNNDPRAEEALRQLENCPSTTGETAKQLLVKLTDSKNCNPIRNKAQAQIMRKDRDGACASLDTIEKTCPNWEKLPEVRKIVGECRKAPTFDNEKDFKEAQELHKSCDWERALAILQDIKKRSPGYSGLENEIAGIQKDSNDIKAAIDPANRGLLDEAESALKKIRSRGISCVNDELANIRDDIADLDKAERACEKRNSKESLRLYSEVKERNESYTWLEKEIDGIRKGTKCAGAAAAVVNNPPIPPKIVPNDSAPKPNIPAPDTQRQQLRTALQSYYSGDYTEAGKLLRSIVGSGEASPQSKTLAKFYLGAALLNSYFLGGETGRSLESEALVFFRQVKDEAPGFAPPADGISKRVLERFHEGKRGNP